MIAFLNERSLEEHVNWENALKLFLEAAQQLGNMGIPLKKDSTFFFNQNFKKQFGSLSFREDVKGLIRQVAFSERYYKCWRPSRISGDDVYLCDAPRLELLDESLCEATELVLREVRNTAALSASDSEFKTTEVLAVTNTSSGKQALVRNITSLELVTRWITQQRGYYSPDSSDVPEDFQTILEKSPRFRFIGKRSRKGSRKVFEEAKTGRLYHVCTAHYGRSAHLEVFSANGEHYGKADIESGEQIAPKIKGRKLRL